MINIMDNFDNVARQHPGKTAVIDNGRSCSFCDLHASVVRNALRISSILGGGKNKIVAVMLPKSMETIVSDLAILYSGNAYMNLDANAPRLRLEAILAQTTPALIIAPAGAVPESNIPCIAIEDIRGDEMTKQMSEEARSLRGECIDTDLACLINTSGSTGVPKAVALAHRGFIDFMNAVDNAGLMLEKAIMGSLSPAIFDIFSFELCMLAIKGSSISLLPEKMAAFPVRLLQIMAETHVNFIFWVPTIMVNIANMDLLGKVELPDLKMVWFAGEVFPTAKFNYWRECLPEVVFANFYGPIEITLDCLYFVVKNKLPDNEPIPIGRPFANTSVLVLDDDDREILAGEMGREGELCVRGSSLALGYYRNPEKTAAAFVQNPLNHSYPEIIYRTGDIVAWNEAGDLMFLGRKDTLIKRYGYRIELGELEHVAVDELKLAHNCCALYYPQKQKIVLVYEAPEPVPDKELARKLATVLPRYMLPNEFRHVKEMPRNANGKIDRMALKSKYAARDGK